MKYLYTLSILLILLSAGCKKEDNTHDATGTFETTEIIVSAESNGQIISFESKEGEQINAGQDIMQIDTTALSLQKQQVLAKINSLSKKKNDARPQIDILKSQEVIANDKIQTLNTQLEVLEIEQNRVQKLYNAEAATHRQLDAINGKVKILNQQIHGAKSQKSIINTQIESTKRSVAIQNRGIGSEAAPLYKQIDIINYQIKKAKVLSPVQGTVLNKYVEQGEFVNVGKPMLKLGDLSEMILRVYITGDQLDQIKLGEEIKVFIDKSKDEYKEYEGRVSWISDVAEFTPKTIQTKNERANLVYAVKLNVINDGYIKIGMYGEVEFNRKDEE